MPRRERLHNNSLTTLNGGITAAATTVTVADGTVFPNEGDFRVIVNEEIMLVTAVSGNNLTVVRGSEGTSAAIQADGAACRCILTAGALDKWGNDLTPGYADRKQYKLIDDAGDLLVDSDFTWIATPAGSTTSQDESWGGISYKVRNQTDQYTLQGKYVSAPTAPWKVTAHMISGPGLKFFDGTDATAFGIFAQSAAGKIITCHNRIGDAFESWKLTNYIKTTSEGDNYDSNLGSSWTTSINECWLQIEDNNTNIITRVSMDGINWLDIGSEGRTAWDASGMVEIGFFTDSHGSNGNAWYHVNSFVVE